MSDSGSGIDFIEADFGETNAAGGAYHLNKPPEYWDKWVNQGTRAPLWPLFFLILCSISLAALPIVVENLMPRGDQPQQQTAPPQTVEQPIVEQLAPVQQAQPAPDQASYPAAEYYSTSPGYDPRFGRPAR